MFMVPTKILPTLLTPLFSLGTKLRMAAELFRQPYMAAEDESVAALVERHFGSEMVDRLADPLLSGVYGADSDKLSVRAVLPRFVEMERRIGSLSRGMLAARKRMTEMLHGQPRPPLFSSLKGGMQQLVDAVAAHLELPAIRTGREVRDIRFSGTDWELTAGDQREHFDALIVATPAHVAAQLLANADLKLAEDLSGISYSSSVTASLIYDRKDLAGHDHGFGFLVPRSEGCRMLACTFVHNKFPHRAPENLGIVRGFLGGLRDQGALNLSDNEILFTLRLDLRELTGLRAEPRAVRIYRWNQAMAQPTIGHVERIARIETRLATIPGLALAGNYFRGIGVPDCVRTGAEAARKVGAPTAKPVAADQR
jgi:oxygen-dependent protoporphyrinogen oxidase